jgi:hypothetical protein
MRGKALFLAGALAALAAGWAGFPRVIYRSQRQPVNFSHKVHTEKAGSKCDDCHAFRDDGSFAGIPTLDKCAGCHSAPMGTTAEEKSFIDRFVTPNREPEWLSYARQPENVYFPHIAHVKGAGLACERCHGAHGATDSLRPFEQDRVGGYSRDIWGRPKGAGLLPVSEGGMRMDDCVDCHRQKGLSHSCMDCHK